jgi:prevent-host-death family protein
MVHMLTVSKTDLARHTRQIVDRARRGEAIIVESYGEEQVAVIDATDYRILCAVAVYHAPSSQTDRAGRAGTELVGLSEAQLEEAVRETGGALQQRWNAVIAAYLAGQINTGRAATLLSLSSFELDDRFRRLGIPRRIGPDTAEEAQSEIGTALDLIS